MLGRTSGHLKPSLADAKELAIISEEIKEKGSKDKNRVIKEGAAVRCGNSRKEHTLLFFQEMSSLAESTKPTEKSQL